MVAANPPRRSIFAGSNPRPVNYSAKRRATVLSLLRDDKFQNADLDDEVQIAYVLACLACDSTGGFTKSDVMYALSDPSAIQYAGTLLREARAS